MGPPSDIAPVMDFPVMTGADMNSSLTTLFPNASMINGNITSSALFTMDSPGSMNNISTNPQSNYTSQTLLQQLMDDSMEMDFNDTLVNNSKYSWLSLNAKTVILLSSYGLKPTPAF